jgi:radical SAM superfamily enzyme YgiQ (UPF0313 family)
VLHLEANPGNARALIQKHGDREVWLNAPPIPLTTKEMDYVYGMPYARKPHPSYGDAKISAWEMIRFSVNIMRGCFGGCTFCSITEHEGRIIQSRSEESILKEVEELLTGAEPKAFEDMSPHEKLVEIGRRENIKYNKQINKFGDGYDC